MKLTVSELTRKVYAAAIGVRKELEATIKVEKDAVGAYPLLSVQMRLTGFIGKLGRRIDYTAGKPLETTNHLCYEAGAVLMEGPPWQSKIGAIEDYVQEVDRLMKEAGMMDWPK